MLGLLCLAAWAGSASGGPAQARWAVEGAELAPIHASFHVHTQWGAWRHGEGQVDTVDHGQCETPDRVRVRAAATGLQLIAFTDHCFQLDPWEWGLRPWNAVRLPHPEADWRRLTILGNSGGESNPDQCLALAGFEWTPGADWWDIANLRWGHGRVGHINVFYPDLGADDIGNDAKARTHPVLYGRRVNSGSKAFAREAPMAAVDCPDLKSLYARLREQVKRGSKPLAQFNHPVTRLGGGQRSRSVEAFPGHFNDFAFDPQLVDCFVLLEIATTTARKLGTKRIVWCDMLDNEPAYQRALAAGWRLGPAIGVDNDDERLAAAASSYTGVWLPPGPFTLADVAAALRQRRVFATEIPGLAVTLQATDGSGKVTPMGGEAQAPQEGKLQLQADFLMEDGSAVPTLLYVRVVEVRSSGDSAVTDTQVEDGRATAEVTPGAHTRCYYVRAACAPADHGPERGLISAPIWVRRPAPRR
ncbi:hypothetical protein LLH23_02495 [bacterium]|nr:hypothetical protein [bacterium]